MASNLMEQVRAVLGDLLSSGEVCLIAASGGRDSMVLLDVCAELSGGGGGFVAGTVDHGLRPFEAEAGILERFCAVRGIPWDLARLEPGLAQRARGHSRSLEDQSRRERYAALADLTASRGATRILTAHTVEDQAETLLLRLLRGAGPMGLAGILAERGAILRPLLDVDRAAVAAWAEARRVPWVRDPGNEDQAIRRSRLRELLPELEAAAPGAARVLARNAAVAADHAEGLKAWALEHFQLSEDAGLPLRLPLDRVGHGPAARVRLHALLRGIGAGDRLTRQHILALEDLGRGAEGRAASLPGGLQAARHGDHLVLGPAEGPHPLVIGPREASHPSQPVLIPGPGRYETPLGVLLVSLLDSPAAVTDPRVETVFALDGLALPLSLRSPRSGERLRPFGMGGHSRLVSDLFSEARVPRSSRGLPRVLEDAAGQVLWILGCRRGDAAPVGPDTAVALRLRLVEEA